MKRILIMAFLQLNNYTRFRGLKQEAYISNGSNLTTRKKDEYNTNVQKCRKANLFEVKNEQTN